MKIRITELLFITAVFALAIACLVRADPKAEFLFGNFAYLVLLISIPMAIGRTHGPRAFWIGFAVTGMLYIAFSLVPDADGYSPRLNGNEITTILSREAFSKLEELSENETDDPFAANSGRASGLSLIRSSGTRVVEADEAEEFETETEDANQTVANGVFGGGGSEESGLGGGFGGGGTEQSELGGGITAADFQPLIDLIQETVGEDDWAETGTGVGAIQAFPANITCMIVSRDSPSLECFVATAHSAWALLLGWIVGHASRFVYETREATTS